jgi:hypothetical protein
VLTKHIAGTIDEYMPLLLTINFDARETDLEIYFYWLKNLFSNLSCLMSPWLKKRDIMQILTCLQV